MYYVLGAKDTVSKEKFSQRVSERLLLPGPEAARMKRRFCLGRHRSLAWE